MQPEVMMKNKYRIKAAALFLLLSLLLSACASAENGAEEQTAAQNTETKSEAEQIPDLMLAEDGKYEIGFCCANAGLKDNSFSEGSYNGVKLFAKRNGLSYKYYLCSGANPTDDDYYDALKAAVDGGAGTVLCASFNYGAALSRIAAEHPEVNFVFIDGWAMEGLDNVAALTFREQECGFLAGYAAVMDGFSKLGFCGGGGGTNDAVNRYGWGYVQGAEQAAAEKGITVDMNYTYQYGAAFSASPELQAMCNAWYESGTEVIFSCGGQIFNSIAAAASANDAYVIGVDSDQSKLSRTVITSAMKRVDLAAEQSLEAVYSGNWAFIGGTNTVLGISEGAIGLAIDTSRFRSFTKEAYEELMDSVLNGKYVIDGDFSRLDSTAHVKLKIM